MASVMYNNDANNITIHRRMCFPSVCVLSKKTAGMIMNKHSDRYYFSLCLEFSSKIVGQSTALKYEPSEVLSISKPTPRINDSASKLCKKLYFEWLLGEFKFKNRTPVPQRNETWILESKENGKSSE